MATAKQSDVTWVKKGDMVNGKKAAKGYLALRSDKSKAFSGTVTGVKSGTTSTRGGTAKYVGGKNVYKAAERRSAQVSGGKASTTSSSSYARPAAKASKNIGYTPNPVTQERTVAQRDRAKGMAAGKAIASNRSSVIAKSMSANPRASLAAVQRAIAMKNAALQNARAKASSDKRAKDSADRLAKEIQTLKTQLKNLK